MESVTYLLILLVCLVGSAFFAGSETALLRIRGTDLEEDVKRAKGPAVLAARELLHSVQRLLVTVLLGQNIVNTLGAAVASALFVRYLGDSWGIVAATVVMTLVTFLFGEVVPKAFAASHPKRVAYLVALPLYLLHQLLRPLHILYDRIIDPLIERLAGGPDTAPQMSSVEELMRLARGAEAQTSAGDRPIGIIAAAARAVDMTVADIMVPRTEVVGVLGGHAAGRPPEGRARRGLHPRADLRGIDRPRARRRPPQGPRRAGARRQGRPARGSCGRSCRSPSASASSSC